MTGRLDILESILKKMAFTPLDGQGGVNIPIQENNPLGPVPELLGVDRLTQGFSALGDFKKLLLGALKYPVTCPGTILVQT